MDTMSTHPEAERSRQRRAYQRFWRNRKNANTRQAEANRLTRLAYRSHTLAEKAAQEMVDS